MDRERFGKGDTRLPPASPQFWAGRMGLVTLVVFLACWQKTARCGPMALGPTTPFWGESRVVPIGISCRASPAGCVPGNGGVGARLELEGCWAGTPALADARLVAAAAKPNPERCRSSSSSSSACV